MFTPSFYSFLPRSCIKSFLNTTQTKSIFSLIYTTLLPFLVDLHVSISVFLWWDKFSFPNTKSPRFIRLLLLPTQVPHQEWTCRPLISYFLSFSMPRASQISSQSFLISTHLFWITLVVIRSEDSIFHAQQKNLCLLLVFLLDHPKSHVQESMPWWIFLSLSTPHAIRGSCPGKVYFLIWINATTKSPCGLGILVHAKTH